LFQSNPLEPNLNLFNSIQFNWVSLTKSLLQFHFRLISQNVHVPASSLGPNLNVVVCRCSFMLVNHKSRDNPLLAFQAWVPRPLQFARAMPFRRPAEEKAKQARQRQVFIGAEGHEGHLRFNLVAELRLLLQTMAMFLLVTFVVLCWATSDETEIKAVVSSFGAVWTGLGVGRSFNAMLGVNNMTEPTSTSAILAITTTTDVPVQLTSNKAILATSTAMGPANQHAMTTAILATTTTNDLVSQSTSSQPILATSTTTEWTARATMSTAVLAKSTTTEPSVQQPQTSSTAILAIPTTSVQQVGDPKFLTTINAILAKSTASSRLMENKIAMVI
jgi:hypothetical protein